MEKHKNEFIKRTKRRDNFVMIGNEVIQDDRITIEARGVLVFLLSLPQDWVVRKNDLQKRLKVSRRTIDRCFDEMKQCGYLCETDFVKKDGKFDGKGYLIYDYSIFGNPPEMFSTDAHSEQRSDLTDAQGEHRTGAHGEQLTKNTEIQQRTHLNTPPISPKGERENFEINNDLIDKKGLDDAVDLWLEYKREKKQKYKGSKSTQVMINNLWKMSNGNSNRAMEIVEFSMGNNYSGLVEPRQSKNNFASNANQPSSIPVKQKVEYYNTRWPDRIYICTEEQFKQICEGNPDESYVVKRKFSA